MKSSTQVAFALLVLILGLLVCTRGETTPQASSENTIYTIKFNHQERTYILHIPTSYNGSIATPLVLSLHGGGGNAESEMSLTNFNPLADEKGFIVAYPNGNGRLEDKLLTWNGGTCCGYAATNNIDDVGFVRAVVAELESAYNIDPNRIYATGLSNGAIMSYRLACEVSDLFAAIGPVSGTQNISRCQPKQPVSIIHFHGTADQHVPYDGGVGDESLVGVDFASVQDSIRFWVKQDQCSSAPETQTHDDIQLDTYSNCSNGSAVELYTIMDGLHAWPGASKPGWIGGDKPTQSISATQLIWEFFQTHPKQ